LKLKLLCAALFIVLASCSVPVSSRAEFALGTVCSITVFDKVKDSVLDEVFARIREIDNLMSVNIPVSDVSRINAAAGIKGVQVHEDVFRVIERAVYCAELSGGAFDPTVGPLVSLWGMNGDNPKVPSQEEIESVLPLVNCGGVQLDANSLSVFLIKQGMALDLGGIAKGYAADEAAAIIKKHGVKRALIDLGGNILVIGENSGARPWRVGVQNPLEKRYVYMGIIRLSPEKNQHALSTSGTYERFFEADGKSYHHIFSPALGYPAENGLYSVTVIAHNSMDADALSTAVFVLGAEKGKELIDSIPGTEAVFVLKDKSVQKTAGAGFTITDNSFRF
jgi:thiamine biosynthesis lipoprotein